MKSVALYLMGNATLLAMWGFSLLAQMDNSFFALSTAVVTLITAGFGAIWLQLWKGQAALMAEKDKIIEREEERYAKLEESLDRQRARNRQLEDFLHEAGLKERDE